MPSATSPRIPTPPLAVPPKEAGGLLSVRLSRLYELLRAGELQSYEDGYSRRITMASIYGYVERRLADSGASGGKSRHSRAAERTSNTNCMNRKWSRPAGTRPGVEADENFAK